MDINNNCIIGLCVYNNERGLPSVLSNIVKISQSKLFDKITVVVFYDASLDNSYSILESFKIRITWFACDLQPIILILVILLYL